LAHFPIIHCPMPFPSYVFFAFSAISYCLNPISFIFNCHFHSHLHSFALSINLAISLLPSFLHFPCPPFKPLHRCLGRVFPI
jgi:hypothetical protein